MIHVHKSSYAFLVASSVYDGNHTWEKYYLNHNSLSELRESLHAVHVITRDFYSELKAKEFCEKLKYDFHEIFESITDAIIQYDEKVQDFLNINNSKIQELRKSLTEFVFTKTTVIDKRQLMKAFKSFTDIRTLVTINIRKYTPLFKKINEIESAKLQLFKVTKKLSNCLLKLSEVLSETFSHTCEKKQMLFEIFSKLKGLIHPQEYTSSNIYKSTPFISNFKKLLEVLSDHDSTIYNVLNQKPILIDHYINYLTQTLSAKSFKNTTKTAISYSINISDVVSFFKSLIRRLVEIFKRFAPNTSSLNECDSKVRTMSKKLKEFRDQKPHRTLKAA